MKLSKALSEKNRLARKTRELQNKIELHNSFIKGNTPPYDTLTLMEELKVTIVELTDLKAGIQRANQPVQHLIFRMAELKSLAAFLRKLKIKEGLIAEERWNAEVREWQAVMGTVTRDRLLESIEKEIDDIQTELDRFNVETEI